MNHPSIIQKIMIFLKEIADNSFRSQNFCRAAIELFKKFTRILMVMLLACLYPTHAALSTVCPQTHDLIRCSSTPASVETPLTVLIKEENKSTSRNSVAVTK